jgi:hypothetical protein
MKKIDLSVLIGSCNEYNFLWKNFDVLFQKYWQLKTKNYFVTETINFDNPHYDVILAGMVPWGQRILTALNEVKTKYVFFILEDYYLSESFTEENIINHIELLEKHQSDKIMFEILDSEYSLHSLGDGLYKFDVNSKYLNSIQPSIWRTDYLRKIINPNFTPWDFELVGNEYTKKINPNLLLKSIPNRMYFNFIRRGGHLSSGYEDFLKKENLTI